MVKADSIAYSFTAIHARSMKKQAPVTDFKNKNKTNYKDTQITLTEGSSSAFFRRSYEHVLVCWDILRNNKLAGHLKDIYIKPSSTQ